MMEKKMMEEFQKINKRRQSDGMCITPLVMFSEAWDARQAEVDELRGTIEGWKDEYRIMTLRYERLQKRIDEALNFYNIAKSDVNIGMMQMAIYLKGKENEN